MFFDEQLTEAGVIGTLGVLVVRLANTEDSPEVENVIHQHRSLVENSVKKNQTKPAFVMEMSRAQVRTQKNHTWIYSFAKRFA